MKHASSGGNWRAERGGGPSNIMNRVSPYLIHTGRWVQTNTDLTLIIYWFSFSDGHILTSSLQSIFIFCLPQPPRAPPCQLYILLLPLLFPLFPFFTTSTVHVLPPPLPAHHPLPGSISANFLLLLNWDEGRMEEKIKGWTDEPMLGMSANGASVKFSLQNCSAASSLHVIGCSVAPLEQNKMCPLCSHPHSPLPWVHSCIIELYSNHCSKKLSFTRRRILSL